MDWGWIGVDWGGLVGDWIVGTPGTVAGTMVKHMFLTWNACVEAGEPIAYYNKR